MADGCKIIVCLGNMYTDKIKVLNCKIEILNNINIKSRGVGYVSKEYYFIILSNYYFFNPCTDYQNIN